MMPRGKVWMVGLLLALVACGDKPSYSSIRQKAAERGSREYQNELGVVFQTGRNGETNYVKALAWYTAAATPTNHVVAEGEVLVDLLTRYRMRSDELRKVEANQKVVSNWARLPEGETIVIPGSPQAMYNVGAIYEVRHNELGIKTKAEAYKKAAEWYHKGAEAGFVRAQFAYGYALEHGQGVAKDPKKAANWYLLSAKQGMAAAQENLGKLYLTGYGGLEERQLPDAYLWLSIAANSLTKEGNDPGDDLKRVIADCRKALPPDAQARMNRLIEDFKPLEN